MRGEAARAESGGSNVSLKYTIKRDRKAQIIPSISNSLPFTIEARGVEPRHSGYARFSDAAAVWSGVAVAAVLTALAIYVLRALTAEFAVFEPSSGNSWVYGFFSVLFHVYLIGILFPFLLFMCWRARGENRTPNTESVSLPFASIIIPAFNEESNVARALDCALNQDYPAFEVIVVDDGSKDLTKYIANRSRARLIALRRNAGKAKALNVGLKHAKGEIVLFSDSDSFLDRCPWSDYLRQMAV